MTSQPWQLVESGVQSLPFSKGLGGSPIFSRPMPRPNAAQCTGSLPYLPAIPTTHLSLSLAVPVSLCLCLSLSLCLCVSVRHRRPLALCDRIGSVVSVDFGTKLEPKVRRHASFFACENSCTCHLVGLVSSPGNYVNPAVPAPIFELLKTP